jgi:hypothetical protein
MWPNPGKNGFLDVYQELLRKGVKFHDEPKYGHYHKIPPCL